jgi:hypothetical protein
MTQPQNNLHHSYHRHDRTDLSVLRRDAELRTKDPMHPRSTLIHLHAKEGNPSWPLCELSDYGLEHEYVYAEAHVAKGK